MGKPKMTAKSAPSFKVQKARQSFKEDTSSRIWSFKEDTSPHPRTSEPEVLPRVSASSTKMFVLLSFLLILACLSGSFGQEDLRKKAFVFPAASRKASVHMNVPLQEPLTSLSVCLKHHCPLLRPYSLFSYATRSSDNDFLIFKDKPDVYCISVGGSDVRFKIPRQDIPSWEHICVSWNSQNGLINFWLNGVLLPRLGTKRGHRISHQASIILGQDQDTFGGGFDINQSFVGDMSEVHMWPRVLTTEDVRLLLKDDTVPNPLASWNAFNYTIQDYVVLTEEVP